MNNIINITQFNEIVNGIKAMKSDFVCVNGNVLYGTDNTFSNLKIYRMDIEIPVIPFMIITKTLSGEFYNNITDTSIIIDFDTGKIYCPNNKSFADECPIMITLDTEKVQAIAARVATSINNPMYICENYGDITIDENFERIKTIKSAEGADLYVPKGVKTHAMYLYTGAIPMTKQDKIFLKVYDLGETFISNFTIYKKKSNPVDLYFRFVKLQG